MHGIIKKLWLFLALVNKAHKWRLKTACFMSCDGLVKNSSLSWALFFERLDLTFFLWGSGEFQIHRDKFERSDPGSQWFHAFFFFQSFQDDVLKPWNLMKKPWKNLGSLESSDSLSSRGFLSGPRHGFLMIFEWFFQGEDESPFWCETRRLKCRTREVYWCRCQWPLHLHAWRMLSQPQNAGTSSLGEKPVEG